MSSPATSPPEGPVSEGLTRFRWERAVLASDLEPITKLVALVIATHVGARTLRAWPTMRTLARETGTSLPTVVKHTRIIERRGFLHAHPRSGEGRAWNQTAYSILLPPGVQPALTPLHAQGVQPALTPSAGDGDKPGARGVQLGALGDKAGAGGVQPGDVMALNGRVDKPLSGLREPRPTRSKNKTGNREVNTGAPLRGAKQGVLAPDGAPANPAPKPLNGNGESESAWQERDRQLDAFAVQRGLVRRAGESVPEFRVRVWFEMAKQSGRAA